MTVRLASRFWGRWYKASELKKVDIIKELEIEKTYVNPHATATLVNSFLVDLTEYLKDQYEKKRARARRARAKARK